MNYRHIFAIAMLGFLAACASEPKRIAQLDEARSKVEALSQEPLAQEVASKELSAAQENLKRADEALEKGEPEEQVAHLAYLAAQSAEIGKTRVDEAEAREQVAQGEAERTKVLLDARTQEAEMAKQRAAEAELAAAAKAEEAETKAQEAESARAALAELQAKQTQRGMVLTLSDVLFDTAAATLKPGAAVAIDRLAKYLESSPESRVIIEGHTDSRGSEAYNEDLSRRRAEAVAEELVTRGIASDRFEVIGRGEGYPVANNGTAEGRQQNRRVEIVFSNQSGQFAPAATTGALQDE
jgi:outer membrane protein OmpA-like peptidoglycan-associated protein